MNDASVDMAIGSLRSPEGFLYAGLPKFRALFGRDSLIAALALLDYGPDIPVATLRALEMYQGATFNPETLEEPGKIIHEFQHDVVLVQGRLRDVPWLKHGKNYFSVDSTPLFVILCYETFQRYGGQQPGSDLIISAEKALRWIVEFGIRDTFLSYSKAVNGHGLQSQSWRDGIGHLLEKLKNPVSTVGVQGYAYDALNKGKILLEGRKSMAGVQELIDAITDSAASIRENLDNYFYLDDMGYYGMAVDGDGVIERTVSSDPGHLIASGILSREKERLVINRLMEEDLFTDYGIRCLSSDSCYFDEKAYQRGAVWPHDNFMIAYGLDKRGYKNEAKELKNRLLDSLDKIGSFPEYIGVDRHGKYIPNENMRIKACDPQAWTVGAYYYSSLIRKKA